MWKKILSSQVLCLVRDNTVSLKKKGKNSNFSKTINQLKHCKNIHIPVFQRIGIFEMNAKYLKKITRNLIFCASLCSPPETISVFLITSCNKNLLSSPLSIFSTVKICIASFNPFAYSKPLKQVILLNLKLECLHILQFLHLKAFYKI